MKDELFKIGDKVEAIKSIDYEIGWTGVISFVGKGYVNVDWDNEHSNCFVSTDTRKIKLSTNK